MEKVITYGTFDLFHPGHAHILDRAKELGDYLIVGVSTDEFNAAKGKKAYQDFYQRKYILEHIKPVDYIIPEISWEQKIDDIKKYDVSTFTIGDDWEGKFDFLKPYCDVVYLKRTEGISSTSIREDFDMNSIKTEELEREIEKLKSYTNVYKALYLKQQEITNTAMFINESNITKFIGMEELFALKEASIPKEDLVNKAILAICIDNNKLERDLKEIEEARKNGNKVIFITNRRVKDKLDPNFTFDNELILPTKATTKSSLSAVMALQMIASELDRLNLQNNNVKRKTLTHA